MDPHGAPPKNYQRLPVEARRLLELPIEPYLGLSLTEAEQLASAEGRFVRTLSDLTDPRRSDLHPGRINVVVGSGRRVEAADVG